jgi:cytochrome c biogenesis factor
MWLWIGSAILALGGVLSIADRGRRALGTRQETAQRRQAEVQS